MQITIKNCIFLFLKQLLAMDAIIQYFNQIPSLHRALILAGGISFFWLVEGFIPLFKFRYKKLAHALPNIFFTLTTVVVNFTFAFALVTASNTAIANKFGILQWVQMPIWLMAMVGIMLLDLVGAYTIHLIEHKVKWMWRFHMVHHADTHVDTTTANRHHPGESVFRAVFTAMGILVCGAPIWLFMLYQSISVVVSQFNHANIRLPLWLDTAISYVLVSPNMHKVHHHIVRPQTDSNYGNIFSIWDRLFGTFNYTPIEQIQYGLDVLDNNKDEQLGYQITLPFNTGIKTDE
jgi:sterol desaturase/sphingolipid hydroxylase (fatty acid hydroxylase superfamily)